MSGRLIALLLFLASVCISFKFTAAVPSEGSETCEDIDPDCPHYAEICEESFIETFVIENCQKTCGFCNVTGVQDTCFDVDSECPSKPYICKLKSHRLYAEKSCRKTCKYCYSELEHNELS